MISEQKVKIMTAAARYEKKYGTQDFHMNRYSKKDYIRLEAMKMSIALTVAFLMIMAIICLLRMDVVMFLLKEGSFLWPSVGILTVYALIFVIYLYITKRHSEDAYLEMEKRMKIYDKYLEELIRLNEDKEKEDISPTIDPEEEEDGTIINI